MKTAAIVCFSAACLAAPFVVPPAKRMFEQAVAQVGTAVESREEIEARDRMITEQNRVIDGLQQRLAVESQCQLVINDGRQFRWKPRADGKCYTLDLNK